MAHYYEKLHRENQEREEAYADYMRKGAYREAYEVAIRGMNVARGVAESKVEPDYMRKIYTQHLRNWEIRKTNAEKKLATVQAGGGSSSPAGDSTTTYKPSPKQNQKSDLTFDDIVGLEDVKQMLRDKVISPLAHPEVIERYKKKPSRTVQLLLYGPPGTGKTMFAEALANELDMSMHRCKASDIIGSLLGESARNMRAYMEEILADDSPRIMAFIDEFDALAGARSGGNQGADGELNRVVNELLQSIDAMVKSNKDRIIVFVTTTNLPWSIDSAITRGKRLDTQIYVGLPDKPARRMLVRKGLDGGVPPLASDINLDEFADSLKGYSAADIATLCDKISDEPLFRHYRTGENSCVTNQDIRKVRDKYPPSISELGLLKYYKYNEMRGYKTPELT